MRMLVVPWSEEVILKVNLMNPNNEEITKIKQEKTIKKTIIYLIIGLLSIIVVGIVLFIYWLKTIFTDICNVTNC